MISTPSRGSETVIFWRNHGLMIAAVLAFLVTRVVVLAHHHVGTDIRYYHEQVLRAAAGEVPYRDFAPAYPPAAWWVMAWPRSTDWPTYRDRFRRAMLIPDVAAFALLWAMLRRRRPAYAPWGCLTYVATTTTLEYLLYDRLDVGLLFLLMLWAYAWLRALDEGGAGARWWGTVSYLVLGFSVAFKLVPGVMLPFVLLSEVTMGRSWPQLFTRSAGFAIGLSFPFLVHYPSAGFGTLSVLHYHLARGIQIESVYAMLLWMLSAFGVRLAVANLRDTVALLSPAVPLMVQLSNVLSVVFVAALGVHALWLRRRYDGEKAYVHAELALIGVILLAKGLSPQYFIWIIPILILCGAELLSAQRFPLLCALLTILSVLTTVVFPIGFRGLVALNPGILSVLAGRNLLFAAVVVWMVARLLRCERSNTPAGIAGECSTASDRCVLP